MLIHIIHPNMSSSNHPRSKPLRVAKVSVRPIWRRKLDTCHNPTNDVVQTQPTPKPHPNEPFHTHNQSSICPPSFTHNYPSSQVSPPPRVSPPLPTINHTPPSSPTNEHLKFVDELKEAHELNALLALHLAQSNLDQPSSSSPPSPHNKSHIEKHVNNCPCCIFLQKQTIALNEHFTWIEYILTRSNPTPSLEQHQNPYATCSTPNSPPPISPSPHSPTSMHPKIHLH